MRGGGPRQREKGSSWREKKSQTGVSRGRESGGKLFKRKT